jgi:hypothetical protein
MTICDIYRARSYRKRLTSIHCYAMYIARD